MQREIERPFNLEQIMLARTSILSQMIEHGLSLDLTQQFTFPDIIDACKRIDSAELGATYIRAENIQTELIQNINFAAYYAKLLDMVIAAKKAEDGSIQIERQISEAGYGGNKKMISPDRAMYRLADLLTRCWKSGQDITAYPDRNSPRRNGKTQLGA